MLKRGEKDETSAGGGKLGERWARDAVLPAF